MDYNIQSACGSSQPEASPSTRQDRGILHLITGLGLGGAERSLVRLLPLQIEAGWNPEVVSLTPHDWYADAVIKTGAPLHRLEIQSPIDFLLKIRKVRKIGRRFNPAVVHCWMYHAGVMGALAFPDRPLIFGVRHTLSGLNHDTMSTRLAVHAARVLNDRFSAIVSNSSTARKEHEDFGFHTSAGMVIPNGFNTGKMKYDPGGALKIRQELGVESSDSIILNIARYHRTKNQEGIIRAFGLIAERFPNTRLVLAGKDVNWGNARLRDAAEKAGVLPRLLLLGRRSDVAALLSAADLFVLGSRGGESFPNVVAEAMLCERPVVATAVGDSASIVGEDNPVAPPDSVDALAEAMVSQLNLSTEQKQRIGCRNRANIVDRFSIEREAASYSQLYSRLIEGKLTETPGVPSAAQAGVALDAEK